MPGDERRRPGVGRSQPVGRQSPTRSEPFLSDERQPLSKDANQKGPHSADPLKAWGDMFANQCKVNDALAKHDEALKYAPNWKQLKEAREAAAKQSS